MSERPLVIQDEVETIFLLALLDKDAELAAADAQVRECGEALAAAQARRDALAAALRCLGYDPAASAGTTEATG